MKLIIDIPDQEYEDIQAYNINMDGVDVVCESILHGTPIPDNATNGEVLQKVFGCGHSFNIYHAAEIAVGLDGDTEFTISWWNAPYKAEREEHNNEKYSI